jgi:hypothetical protein
VPFERQRAMLQRLGMCRPRHGSRDNHRQDNESNAHGAKLARAGRPAS